MSTDKSDSTSLQSSAVINEAVQTLRDGGLVAFPTETVYGHKPSPLGMLPNHHHARFALLH